MDAFEDLLQTVKPFGRFQIAFLASFGSYACFIAPFAIYMAIFMSFPVEHRCRLPQERQGIGGGADNMTQAELAHLINISIPFDSDTNRPDSCNMWNESSIGWNASGAEGNTTTEKCTYGYVYDQSKWSETLGTKFDLVCDKAKEYTNVLTLGQAGSAAGALLGSPAQDLFGRVPLIIFFYTWTTVCGIMMLFVNSLSWLKVSMFLFGMETRFSFTLPWIYCTEMTDIHHQGVVMTVTAISFGLGAVTLACVAWVSKTWKTILLTTAVLHAVLIIPSFFIPESARWLLATGKTKRAKKVLLQMATWNKAPKGAILQMDDSMAAPDSSVGLPAGSVESVAVSANVPKRIKSYAYWALYTNGWSMAVKTTVTAILQVICVLIYQGLSYNLNNFGNANPYIVYIITCLVEIPAAFMVGVANVAGRVPTAGLSFMVCALFSFASTYVDSSYLLIFCVFMTKFCITLAFDVVFMINAELFPTAIRATAMGYSLFFSVIAAIAVPEVVFLAANDERVPLIIFSLCALVGGLLSFILPETAGSTVIDTLEQEKGVPISWKSIRYNLTGGELVKNWRKRRGGRDEPEDKLLDKSPDQSSVDQKSVE